jgi:sortase A
MSAQAPAPPRRTSGVTRRLVRDLSSVLIIAGVLLLLDAAITVAWQEPLTALVGTFERGQINQQLVRPGPLSRLDVGALAGLASADDRMAYLARRERRRLAAGDAIGRIAIPKIGVSFQIVEGTETASLEKGPGHYPGTSLPGLGQTVAIAGHRTTYLAPFRHIDALRPGNRIVVTMPYGRFTYVVQYRRIVAPTALWVIRNVGYDRLVLSACNPLFSAAQRIVVFARLRRAVMSALPPAARAHL